MSARIGWTQERWHDGVLAEEGALVCRPGLEPTDAASQAEAVYRTLAESLADRGASFANLATERLFLRDRRELPCILEARCLVLRELGLANVPSAPMFIEQPPVDREAALELSAGVVIPRDPGPGGCPILACDVRADVACACLACSRSGARLHRLGDEISLHSTTLYGRGPDALEQAQDMFRNARRLLERAEMDFRNVVRTWIYLGDIDRDYAALNQARREFFAECGLEERPASTGVQGVPCGDEHVCGLSLHAISPRPEGFEIMTTPCLNEAWSYGADFSRGLRVVQKNGVVLHLSGTASIDDSGRSVHPGDVEAQAERMLDNIESLLGEQGADFSNLFSGVTYVKRPQDAGRLRHVLRRRAFDRFPCVVLEAPLCRPELLCETEVVALVEDATGR